MKQVFRRFGSALGVAALVLATVACLANPASAAAPPKGTPGRVGDLTATPAKTSVTITWKAPTSGGQVSGYRVQQSTSRTFGAVLATTGAHTTSYTANDVTSGNNYFFAVTAIGPQGSGLSRITTAAVSVGAPGQVSDLQATSSSNTSVALSWFEPVAPGDSSIKGYQVDAVEYGKLLVLANLKNDQTTYTATGLLLNTAYVFTVEASNAAGAGPAKDVTGETASSEPAVAQPAWSELSPMTNPPDENNAATAYDPATGQLVMFGGFGSDGDTDRTWTWDGTTWTLQTPATIPPQMDSASMAYDPATQQLLMFGGETETDEDGNLYSSNTWEWTGTNWQRLQPAHRPPAAAVASMAYDDATRQLILYGGIGATSCVQTTWTWTGTDWKSLSPKANPDACSAMTMSYDDGTGQLILFGGNDDQGGTDNQTWNWTGTNWVQLMTAANQTPDGVAYGSTAYDQLTRQLILFGGYNSDGVNQGGTWEWNGARWRETPLTGPPAGSGGEMAYDAATGQLIQFGGTGAQGTTWAYGDSPHLGLTWDQSTTVAPPARDGASMAYDPATGQLIMFGGEDQSTGTKLDDTWAWSENGWARLEPQHSPSARAFAGMAYDNSTGQLLLFGGRSNLPLNDTWDWTGTDWQQLTPTQAPPVREAPSMAYDDATGQLILFGGDKSNTSFGKLADTWSWTGATWSNLTTATAPSPRSNAAMFYDPIRGVLRLANVSGGTADWTWTSTGWVQSADPALNSSGSSLAFYPYDGKVIGASSAPGSPYNFGGQTPLSPPGRLDASICFDPATGQIVLFGGFVDATDSNNKTVPVDYSDTWLEFPASTAPDAPTALTAVAGDNEVDLNWTPPQGDGGEPISGYNVYVGTTSGGESATPINSSPLPATATSYDATGLATGTNYYFTVVAQNSIGKSPASNQATTATFGIPTDATNLTAVPGDTTATVNWSPPTSDGGTPITGYDVFAGTGENFESAGPVNSSPLAADATSYQVTGLTDATTYNFAVVAINEIGDSPGDNVVTATPFEEPSSPTAGVLAGNGQLQVTWQPGPDNGSEITGYNVFESTSSGAEGNVPINRTELKATARSLLVTGLTNGATYYFQVSAINAAGEGPGSAEVSAVPGLVPATITDLSATSSSTKVELEWKVGAPASGVGATTGYNVYRGATANFVPTTPINSTPLSASTKTFTESSLTKGDTFYFIVEAVNNVGSSLLSNVVSGAIEIAPSTVNATTAKAAPGQVKLTWAIPLKDGGTPITGFNIYQSTNKNEIGNKVDSVSSTQTQDVITGLQNGTRYYFVVRAVNAVGQSDSDSSAQANAEPIGPPDAPTVTASAAQTAVTLMWTKPNDGGSAITGYIVTDGTIDARFPTTHKLNASTLTLRIGGLTKGDTYKFSVQAINKYGTGAAGTITVTTT